MVFWSENKPRGKEKRMYGVKVYQNEDVKWVLIIKDTDHFCTMLSNFPQFPWESKERAYEIAEDWFEDTNLETEVVEKM